MTSPFAQQRCWNHEAREAVCRCPSCGRSFCRECVSEHESRWLCAACIHSAVPAGGPRISRWRSWIALAAALAGILISCMVFYGAGAALLDISTRMERPAWRAR